MDIYTIVIAPKARMEIEKIAEYVRTESEQAAESIGDKFEEAIDSLNILPRRHPVHDIRRGPDKNIYGMVVFLHSLLPG